MFINFGVIAYVLSSISVVAAATHDREELRLFTDLPAGLKMSAAPRVEGANRSSDGTQEVDSSRENRDGLGILRYPPAGASLFARRRFLRSREQRERGGMKKLRLEFWRRLALGSQARRMQKPNRPRKNDRSVLRGTKDQEECPAHHRGYVFRGGEERRKAIIMLGDCTVNPKQRSE